MEKISKWWIASASALMITAALGVGAVMAQEGSPSPTVPAQGTPDAQATPNAQQTPDSTTPGDDGSSDRRGGCGLKGASAEELAAFLGIAVDALRTELSAEGATLATVAAAHGQSRESLIAFLTQETQTALAERVADGSLTQAEADEKLSSFSENVDEFVDSSSLGRGHGQRGGGNDGGSTPSGATDSNFRS